MNELKWEPAEEAVRLLNLAAKAAGVTINPVVRDEPYSGDDGMPEYYVDVDGLCLYPAVYETKSISRTFKHAGWAVDAIIHDPGSYWRPPETDAVPIVEADTLWTAARDLILALVKDRIDNAVVAEAEAERHFGTEQECDSTSQA